MQPDLLGSAAEQAFESAKAWAKSTGHIVLLQ